MKPYRLVLSIIIFSSFLYSSKAQKTDSIRLHVIYDSLAPKNDLLEFPMKELANMKVTVSSKKEEKISEASSSITAYSSKDIENLGYYTLADLASITSGYNVNYMCGEKGFVTRGQSAKAFDNNKHLLLIDGIPVNFARSYKAQIQEELPLYFAERVEFLKGSASALYGVSAFYGAVSVIPKDPVINGTSAESKISMGTWNYNIRGMGNIFHKSNTGISSLSIGYFNKNPSADYVGNTHKQDYRYWDKNNSIFLRSSHKIINGTFNGLTIGIIYMSREGGIGESWSDLKRSSEINEITWRTFVPYLKYQRQLTKKLTLNSYLKGNNSIEEGEYLLDNPLKRIPMEGMSIYKSNVVNIEGLAELRYELNTRNSFILGVNYDRRVEQGNPSSYAYHVIPDSNSLVFKDTLFYDFRQRSFYFNTLSSYFQIQKNISFLSGLTITGGLRYDVGIIGDFNYQQVSPRISIVQKITPKLNLKMMTGRALRAPSIKELDLTNQFLDEAKKNNLVSPPLSQLKAEVIQTYEAGLYYNTSGFGISATLFYNTIVNEITPVTYRLYAGSGKDSLRGNWIVNNTGTTRSRGVEIDMMAVLNNSFKLFSNYTYAVAKDSSNSYFTGIPVSQVNGGITFSNSGKYKLRSSLIVKHIDGYLTGGKKRKLTDGYTFIDMNFIFPLTENISLEAQVRNLLNQHVKFPPTGIPLPGRTYLFTFAARFK